ncbi:MAG: HDOD domain-containing protein [Planctomycetaceae bacterium]|jgi:HD-like signal output (HDOD) protein|nr:HDOD domain-containing protein [Planctomycetaceae bacterium]
MSSSSISDSGFRSGIQPHDELKKILTVEQLPAMPQSALTVLQIDNDLAKVNINDLVRPIEADPGLVAQVLKFLNSSYFGFQSTISNVKQGIALVGIRVVKNFVLWKAVFSLIPKTKGAEFDVGGLWQDSLRRAMFARFLLTEFKRGDAEMAFAGALLQDMAIPMLLKLKPIEYGDLIARHRELEPSVRLSTLEDERFGWNHAQAGGILGRNWKLPHLLTLIIEEHTEIEELTQSFDSNSEEASVAISALLPSDSKDDWAEADLFVKYFKAMLPKKNGWIKNLFERVDREFDQYASIIQIGKPKKKLMDYIDKIDF